MKTLTTLVVAAFVATMMSFSVPAQAGVDVDVNVSYGPYRNHNRYYDRWDYWDRKAYKWYYNSDTVKNAVADILDQRGSVSWNAIFGSIRASNRYEESYYNGSRLIHMTCRDITVRFKFTYRDVRSRYRNDMRTTYRTVYATLCTQDGRTWKHLSPPDFR